MHVVLTFKNIRATNTVDGADTEREKDIEKGRCCQGCRSIDACAYVCVCEYVTEKGKVSCACKRISE